MAEYIDMDVDDVLSFEARSGSTSMGLPLIIESFLASCSALTGIVILHTEKTNSYCKAYALQSIFLFAVFFIVSLPFLILCLAVGHAFQTVYLLLLFSYIVIKLFFVVMAVLRSKSESFIGIPGLATWIYSTAARY
ncbi:hypothetical protein EHI8A_022630 [Entamoeba histolytica HM-1:IMSS-B]|uniref:Uncharacterized protein n=8 Tax=Entamoeba TaxID=5758 RepID=C4M1D3_ENTH1|nr:hypothetical protein ENU1_137680 [Entamoeba nuttalli P19]XP_655979.1 hypothetical protein EHI_170110 [Entamoeba histolytica HM-1:IMSS]EMD45216.1 Hypothetical protein EHI5A_048790 [Entamoeba histolytica KU27]EMH73652.1 hypothetical protein EHI8A_022630 [Entamoeba histolytica HM-1:IMSS-B]EMS13344.1 hypothetical protein KM1_043600 [Entamoeba histolytica HM-3:IMSS]ENY64118.1 hypothetical protein EHI7A_026720 [Entamoeba histolytica HM-1:IMSS-A]GAT95011.1 hypothetical protein CL6EHI_170110 [Enta|eukprot:XP_008858454.1 hypothetical protein ENU1_137680 [Entamoeba nuttalli P19]